MVRRFIAEALSEVQLRCFCCDFPRLLLIRLVGIVMEVAWTQLATRLSSAELVMLLMLQG